APSSGSSDANRSRGARILRETSAENSRGHSRESSEHAMKVTLVAKAVFQGDLSERQVRSRQLLCRRTHAQTLHAVADSLAEVAMEHLAQINRMNRGDASEVGHCYAAAKVRMQIFTGTLRRWQIARHAARERSNLSDELQSARFEIERLAVGRGPVKHQKVPRCARSGQIAQ